ncbi:MAG: tetratricopeptide repeat protein [bacterium]|nr:tetratricopeptide repeat protein [bacterium]
MNKSCTVSTKNTNMLIVSAILSFYLIFISSWALSAQTTEPVSYQKKLLGNEAFKSGLYDVAMDYYKHYLKNSTGNSPAIRDAYFSLIATCLRTNNMTQANIFYNELFNKYKQFFTNNPKEYRRLEYWRAEILLSDEKYQEASSGFSKIISNNKEETSSKIVLDSIAGLGISQFRQGEIDKAYITFTKLRDLTMQKNSKLNSLAINQMILINLLNNNINEANKIIKNAKNSDIQFELLSIFTLIKENKLDEAQNKYDMIKQKITYPNSLCFLVSYTFANSYLAQKKYNKALLLFNDAYRLAPDLYDKERVTIFKINTAINLQDYSKAIRTANTFLTKFPDSPKKNEVLLTLSEALVKVKKYDEIKSLASKYFDFKTKTDTAKVKLANIIGRTFIYIKDYDKANLYFDYIIDNSKDKNSVGEGKYWKTEILFLNKKYDEALTTLNVLQKTYPTIIEKVLYKKAQIYLIQKKYTNASKTLEELLNRNANPDIQPSPILLYAIALKKTGKFENAVDQFISFAKKNSKSSRAAKAYYEAGSLYLLLGNFDKAITYFDKITTDYKDKNVLAESYHKLVYANLLNKHLPDALKYTKILSEKYPNSDFTVQALFWISNYYRNIKQYDKAINELSIIIDNNTKKDSVIAKAYYDKGYILFLDNKNSNAITTLTNLESLYPKSKIINKSYYLMGDILSSEGNYSEAINNYSKALKNSTDKEENLHIASLGRIGDCYFAMLNFTNDKEKVLSQSISFYKKILKIKDLSDFIKVQTLYKLGKCYELSNEYKKAIEMYHESFYSNIVNINNGKNPVKKWFVKSGIALTRLLQIEDTPNTARAAINVLQNLIKYGAQPSQDFQLRINEIKKQYKL